jgi:hypothetical protein
MFTDPFQIAPEGQPIPRKKEGVSPRLWITLLVMSTQLPLGWMEKRGEGGEEQ